MWRSVFGIGRLSMLNFVFAILSAPLDLIYWIKWLTVYVYLRLLCSFKKRRFDVYDIHAAGDPYKIGFLNPQIEMDLELPLSEIELKNASDELFFHGTNSQAEFVVVRVSRGPGGDSEAWLCLRVADGRTFSLATGAGYDQTDGRRWGVGGVGWRLQVHALNPMRKWRMHFCGTLRETSPDGQIREDIFIKFTFIWRASSDLYDVTAAADPSGFAKSIAESEWVPKFYPPLRKVTEALNSYSQAGELSGTVHVDGEDELKMYFFGGRTRNISNMSLLAGCKFDSLIGYVHMSGLSFHVSNSSVPNLFKNLSSGYVVRPDAVIEPATRVCMLMPGVKAVIATEQVSGLEYEISGKKLFQPIALQSTKGWVGSVNLTFIEFTVKDKKGYGFLINGRIQKKQEYLEEVKISPVLPQNTPLITKFTDDISQFEEISGGKGASLGKLTMYGKEEKSFTVPRGLIITTASYQEFLSFEVVKSIEELANVVYGKTKGDVKESCKKIQNLIQETPLPEKIYKQLVLHLNSEFGSNFEDIKFAVRSSSTGEDTESMSSAGQMDTYLGVHGLKEIVESIKNCWASQYGYIAVEYKRRNGQLLNCPMAVVLQQMVACEAAGVLFTCDPLSGNPARLTIAANYGLGETVVSGSVEPDCIVLKRSSENEIEVISIIIGSKHEKIVMNAIGGVSSATLGDNLKNNCCLSEEMAKKLASIAIKVEKYYKSPRDIEWGIIDDEIFLLQSRPITNASPATDYEILHDMDTVLRCENEFFSKANAGEVFPGASSPLGLDAILKCFSSAIRLQTARYGLPNTWMQSNYFINTVSPFCYHIFMTIVDLITKYGIGSYQSRGFVLSCFGRELDQPELTDLANEKKPVPPKANLLQRFFQFPIRAMVLSFWDLFFCSVDEKDLKRHLDQYDANFDKYESSEKLFQAIMKTCSDHDYALMHHMKCTEASSNWNMYLFRILCSANGGFDPNVSSDFARLLSSSAPSRPEVESADVPRSMQNIAEQISKDIDCNEFKSMDVEEILAWLQSTPKMSGCLFRNFIKRHGHRCLKEFDVHVETWGMNPKSLILLLKNLAGSSHATIKSVETDDLEKLFSELNVSLNFKAKKLLQFCLPRCRKAVQGREASKSLVIKSIHFWRLGFHRLAFLMALEGRIPDPELLFFFTIEEIRELLDSRSPCLITRAVQRRKIFPEVDKYVFSEIIQGFPKPENAHSEENNDFIADLTMTGIPVSQGVTKGYARVAISLDDAAHLKPGEILIAYCTDIGWSPYFPVISGVVTELGGLISHGAVVSREYGLPCVVGLHGATKRFKSGDYVLLDGTKGILKRLPQPSTQNAL